MFEPRRDVEDGVYIHNGLNLQQTLRAYPCHVKIVLQGFSFLEPRPESQVCPSWDLRFCRNGSNRVVGSTMESPHPQLLTLEALLNYHK